MKSKLIIIFGFLLMVLAGTQASSLSDGLALYLSGSTVDGQVQDSSGNNLNGYFRGDAGVAAGKFGSGFYFDGSGDYLDIGNNPALDIYGDITVAMWINPNDFEVFHDSK